MLKNENEINSIEPFKVYVRVRPLLEGEIQNETDNNLSGSVVINKIKRTVTVENNQIFVLDPDNPEIYGKKEKCYIFDSVFTEKDNNNFIFENIIKNLVNNILSGYNSTALAYGVTGTGKTHTMFGDIYMNLNSEKGICMYAVDYLFTKIFNESYSTASANPNLLNVNQNSLTTQSIDFSKKFYKVKISYLEIYNEQVVDLLSEREKERQTSSAGVEQQHLMIIDDPLKGTIVPELTEYTVTSSEQVSNLIILGNSRRTMASTSLNQFSSRSHAILQINVEQKIRNKDNLNKEEIITSKLLLVDLAGSERGGLEKGIRREEGANINKSLLALGNCINTLSDKSKKGSFVPYRDSKLTRLLKDSLGGNILTIMIACISPSILSYDETINTLKYASRARKIQKKVIRNTREVDLNLNPNYRDDLVDSLKNEIFNLNEIIKNQNILLKSLPIQSIESFKDERDLINLNLNLNLNINKNKNFTSKRNQQNFLNANANLQGICNEIIMSNNKKQNLFIKNPNSTEEIVSNMNNKIEIPNNNDNKLIDLENFNSNLKKQSLGENSFQNNFGNQINGPTGNYSSQNSVSFNQLNNLSQKNCTNIFKSVNGVRKNSLFGIRTHSNSVSPKKVLKFENFGNHEEFLNKNLNLFSEENNINFCKKCNSNINDKRELEVKNKKYQEFLTTVLKEKDDKDARITELTNELEKKKKKINQKDKKIFDSDKKIRELEEKIKEQKFLILQNKNYAPIKNLSKSTNIRGRSFNDENELRASFRKYFSGSMSGSKNNRIFKKSETSTVNIDLSAKIPVVAAYIHRGNLYSQTVCNPNSLSLANFSATNNNLNNPIINLKKNLNYNHKIQRPLTKSPLSKKLELEKDGIGNELKQVHEVHEKKNCLRASFNYNTFSPQSSVVKKQLFGNKNVKQNSKSNSHLIQKNQILKRKSAQKRKVISNKNSNKNLTILVKNEKEILIKDLLLNQNFPRIKKSNLIKHSTNINNNLHKPSVKNITDIDSQITNKNRNNKYKNIQLIHNMNNDVKKNFMKNNFNLQQIKNKHNAKNNERAKSSKDFYPTESISISAVTYNIDMCLNSSELEVMENVFSLDGIKAFEKMNQYNDRALNSPVEKQLELENFEFSKSEIRNEHKDINSPLLELKLELEELKNFSKRKYLNLESYLLKAGESVKNIKYDHSPKHNISIANFDFVNKELNLIQNPIEEKIIENNLNKNLEAQLDFDKDKSLSAIDSEEIKLTI